MGLFDKLKGPVFLKEDSDAKEQLVQLKALLPTVPDNIKIQIEQDIKILTYGIQGEENILFELKNSYVPMYVLHDLFLEDNGLSAQIDFLIITRFRNFIIECKNLVGNIEVNNNGDFIRTTEFRGKYKKEGIYSPITQNQRYMELVKLLRSKTKGNILTKTLFEKYFYDSYRSVVVLANPKTLLNSKYAKKDIKEKIIRADQLIEYIKRINKEPDSISKSDKEMEEAARFFLGLHKKNPADYLDKYRSISNSEDTVSDNVDKQQTGVESISKKRTETSGVDSVPVDTLSKVYTELKAYRLRKSREENVKPYFLYSDRQLEELIIKSPCTIEELENVSGFGQAKCQKYGSDILNIIRDCL